MTEMEIRQQVVATAQTWLGTKAGSAGHKEILRIYNAQRPLPRGTKMQDGWAWCAVFVSAVALQCDLRDIMPTEMSCHQMTLLYKQLGRWVEDDAYVPTLGDVIVYDWQDGSDYAATDNTGTPDHVGIVTACDGKTIHVIEGNVSNKVGTRVLSVNGRYIRGFGCPDYASKATAPEDTRTDDLARKIATEINDSGLDAAAVLARVQTLLGGTDTPTAPDKPAEPDTPAEPDKPSYDIDAIALEVLRGNWGNGSERRRRLRQAGYDPDVIQTRAQELHAEMQKGG